MRRAQLFNLCFLIMFQLPFPTDEVFQPWNNICVFRKDGKYGVFDLLSRQYTKAIFDDTDLDVDTDLVKFNLNGVEGVLSLDGLKFVPMSEFDEENGHYLYCVLD